jgi:DNA-binding GntR family transcriptional regulator
MLHADSKPPAARADMKNSLIDRPSSLKDAAYREIKDQLVSGQLEHEQIYSAQHFADQLGISRTPAREALLQLAGEGFLVCLGVRGFQVRKFSPREIQDVFETRRMIETFAVKKILAEPAAGDLSALKRTLQAMVQHARRGDIQGFLEADKEFHLSLVRRTGNQLLASIMENIRDHIAIFGSKVLAHQGRFQEVLREHRNILRALDRKDRKRALAAIVHHLATTERQLNLVGLD